MSSSASRGGRSVAAARWINFTQISRDRNGPLIVGLMIVANDILLANWSAVEWSEENEDNLPPLRRHLRIGAQQYFVRLMVSHLHEALPLVEEFRAKPALMSALDRCSPQARDGFAEISACLPGGADCNLFGSQVARLRNKLSFHYDRQHLQQALEHLANDPAHPPAMITMGGDFYLSRFNLADRVCDSVLVHQVLQQMPGKTDREKIEEFSRFVNRKCQAFLRFAREFADRYFG